MILEVSWPLLCHLKSQVKNAKLLPDTNAMQTRQTWKLNPNFNVGVDSTVELINGCVSEAISPGSTGTATAKHVRCSNMGVVLGIPTTLSTWRNV